MRRQDGPEPDRKEIERPAPAPAHAMTSSVREGYTVVREDVSQEVDDASQAQQAA